MGLNCKHKGCSFSAKNISGKLSHERTCIHKPRTNYVEKQKKTNGFTEIPESIQDGEQDRSSEQQRAETDIVEFFDSINDLVNQQKASLVNARENVEPNSRMEVIKSFAEQYCRMERKIGKEQLNELISTIRNDEFCKRTFCDTIKNVEDCFQICKDNAEQLSSMEGFEEVHIDSAENCYSTTIYVRNIVDVLRSQLEEASENYVIFEPLERRDQSGKRLFSNIMETDYGNELCNYVKDKVLTSSDSNVIWYDGSFFNRKSFCGIIQMYSDKCAVTLRKNGISAYPVHVTFLNFKYPEWRRQIMAEKTLLAYLPVEIVENEMEATIQSGNKPTSTQKRNIRREMLHKCLEKIFRPLEEKHLEGFEIRTPTGSQYMCHPILGSITTDLVELKELVCILQGSNPFRPCPKCTVERTNLHEKKRYANRNMHDTKDRRRRVAIIKKEIMKQKRLKNVKKLKELKIECVNILKKHSIMEVESYFEKTPLCPLTRSIDLYTILAFEPMHNLFLGMSKTLKILIFLRLGSENLFVEKDKKKFKYIRFTILKCVNEMLSRMEKESYIPDFTVDFASKTNPSELNGLYCKDGVTGMLEAKNYKCLDTIFPFVAAFIDRCCGEKYGPLTSLCSLYNDIIRLCLHREYSPPWNTSSLQSLKK